MFHADQCFQRKYVEFVDTDTLFVTRVTSGLLFEDGKPIIIGQFRINEDHWWANAAKATLIALGQKKVFRCMSYFPVIFETEHIIEMREYMAKLHKMEFNLVFQKFSRGDGFSQFNIMCNYVWHFHRGDYRFHAQLRNGLWNG